MADFKFQRGNDLDLDEVIGLYRASTLGERRPVEDREIMRGMIENADLIITAWDRETLVGISRSVTDFVYVAYLADLAVHAGYQKRGIGTELIKRTRDELGEKCFLTLLSAPQANDFYPAVGFEKHPRAWYIEPDSALDSQE